MTFFVRSVFQHSFGLQNLFHNSPKNSHLGDPSLTYLLKIDQLNKKKLVAITCNSITTVHWPRHPDITALFFKRRCKTFLYPIQW